MHHQFLPYSKKNFQQHVDNGFPGDTPEEKMKIFRFTPIDGKSQEEHPEEKYPKILAEALQVFECTWMKELDNAQNDKVQDEYEGPYHDFNGVTSKFGAHFILRIDHIIVKEKYYDAIVKVPRPFLKLVLQGCVNWAKENNVKVLTEKEMKIIADKQYNEKKKKK